ncbi:MAG: GNAT family N-acetyltransferase [Deltaproteobacteria bacterium]|nr:GNAT family N-acetyltransferase [Deltaproteobacteria bacterium]
MPPRIQWTTRKDRISVADVAALFRNADWARERTRSEIRRMLKHTDILVMARSGRKPVGFARVITDKTFRAFVEDVIVAPEMRRQGLGRLMIEQAEMLVKKLGIPRMELTSTQTHFWKRLGYRRKTNSTCMVKYLIPVISPPPLRGRTKVGGSRRPPNLLSNR